MKMSVTSGRPGTRRGRAAPRTRTPAPPRRCAARRRGRGGALPRSTSCARCSVSIRRISASAIMRGRRRRAVQASRSRRSTSSPPISRATWRRIADTRSWWSWLFTSPHPVAGGLGAVAAGGRGGGGGGGGTGNSAAEPGRLAASMSDSMPQAPGWRSGPARSARRRGRRPRPTASSRPGDPRRRCPPGAGRRGGHRSGGWGGRDITAVTGARAARRRAATVCRRVDD